jgi:serine/threonine-protein kinase
MMVIDRKGVIQAAGDPDLVGAPYRAPAQARLIDEDLDVSLSAARNADGAETFRFTRPIFYAGRTVGQVDLSLRKDELEAAASSSLTLLIGLGALMMSVALGLSFLGGRLVLGPIRRLNEALRDAAQGRLDFRISHQRNDEFGELFDSFNLLAEGMQERFDSDPLRKFDPAATLLHAAPLAAEQAEAPEQFAEERRA